MSASLAQTLIGWFQPMVRQEGTAPGPELPPVGRARGCAAPTARQRGLHIPPFADVVDPESTFCVWPRVQGALVDTVGGPSIVLQTAFGGACRTSRACSTVTPMVFREEQCRPQREKDATGVLDAAQPKKRWFGRDRLVDE